MGGNTIELITDEIVELIMRAKARMPAGYKILTVEESAWLVLFVDPKDFESYSLTDKIRIAEGLNELCTQIKATGLPCLITQG